MEFANCVQLSGLLHRSLFNDQRFVPCCVSRYAGPGSTGLIIGAFALGSGLFGFKGGGRRIDACRPEARSRCTCSCAPAATFRCGKERLGVRRCTR